MEITDVNTLFGAYPSQRPDSSPEALVATMQAQGVAWCLALSTWGLFHHDTEGNAETLRACRTHERLIPVATLNPMMYWGQGGMIEAITQEPFEMFRFFPQRQGWPLDFAPFIEVLSRLAALPRMPIMVSVSKPGDATTMGRLAADYPHPIILEGVSPTTLAEAILLLRRHPHLYVETHSLQMPGALTLLRDSVGIDRVLFGSDAPGLSLGAALRSVQNSDLTEAEKSAVFAGNAQQIWHNGGEE
jgi:hypothetical protein